MVRTPTLWAKTCICSSAQMSGIHDLAGIVPYAIRIGLIMTDS